MAATAVGGSFRWGESPKTSIERLETINPTATAQVFLNGRIVPIGQASLPVSNPGLLHGVGLFETLRVYNGRPFRLDEHIARLSRSAQILDMPVGESIAAIPDAVRQTIEANELSDARVRFTVFPPGQQASEQPSTLLVAAEHTQGYPLDLYERGMTAHLCTEYRQSRQDPLAGHKTTSYFPRLLALRNARRHDCGEALWFTPENLLAEGSISNVFIVKAGRLRTPPLDTPVLPGVTRATVIELAYQASIPATQEPCTIDELLDADEVFLTNAIMEIMPVTRVERRAIGLEKPGFITRQLGEAYRKLVGDTVTATSSGNDQPNGPGSSRTATPPA